jgi:hypothetical protein
MNVAILVIVSVTNAMMIGFLWLFPKSTKLVLIFFVLADVSLILLATLITWIGGKLFSN